MVNYYTLRGKAAKMIAESVMFLTKNPTSNIEIAMLTIEVNKLGLSEKILHKLLEPHIKTGQIIIEDEAIKCKK